MKFRRVAAGAGEAELGALYRTGWQPDPPIVAGVAEILAAVRTRGDDALVEYTQRFDAPAFTLDAIRVPIPPLERARSLVPADVARALTLAQERVAAYHRRQLPADIEYTEPDGTEYGFYYRPLGSIAAYVPGGTAVLPSSVVMNTVPAKIAGVTRIAVLTPPRRDGSVAPAVLFACALCGVDELYAAGGAHGVAAAAYGTARIARVDKIVGPGNVWVTEAKRQVFGVCAIDGLAGPSEVLVVADAAASPRAVVDELLAQAEHDPQARVAVVSESADLLAQCAALLDDFVPVPAERGAIVSQVLERNTYLIHARSREELLRVAERFAPEHLSLQVTDPQAYLPHLRTAGAVFAGAQTPVACGDYLAGTNHVLPTSGAARFSSGLRTADFLRSFSAVRNSAARMAHDAPLISALAEFEGLPAHARSARDRAR